MGEIGSVAPARAPADPTPADALPPLATLLAAMATATDPCPGFRTKEWPDIWYRALQFLCEREEEAAALGWGTLELLGVHPVVGVTRVDYCGALTLGVASPVKVITAEAIVYDNKQVFRRASVPADAVPIWAFQSREGHD
jgi:hypothetical protein